MRSPIVFDPSNPSQPYNPMAQFLAGSPHISGDGNHKGNNIHLLNGLITPGMSLYTLTNPLKGADNHCFRG